MKERTIPCADHFFNSTRLLTNAFSKKLENFKAAIALHLAYYNLCEMNWRLPQQEFYEMLSEHPRLMALLAIVFFLGVLVWATQRRKKSN